MSLYCYIGDQKQEVQKMLNEPDASERQKDYARGRQGALIEFENFLHNHLDHKLPRRIYRQLKSHANSCDARYAVGR